MGSGFDYTDCREVLKRAYEERKAASPQLTYKALADILWLDKGGTFRALSIVILQERRGRERHRRRNPGRMRRE